jgi:CRP/FNR family transcriptional regulator, cyclic AMP receptor protein
MEFDAVPLEVRERLVGHRLVIAARGEIDLAAIGPLEDAVRRAAESAVADVWVDLSEVEFMDSTGLTALLLAHRAIDGGHRRLAIVCPDGAGAQDALAVGPGRAPRDLRRPRRRARRALTARPARPGRRMAAMAAPVTELAGSASANGARGLLELDPDLGQLLSAERRAQAARELRVRVTSFGVGEWDGGRLADADPTHLGLLLVAGVLAREVVLADTVSTELLGQGDIVRPWHIEGSPQLLPVTVRWNALAGVRLALIDRRMSGQLGRYPEIGAVIVDRLTERAQRLAVTQAISQLNRVDRRLLALFWHLAERWGRVARDGIAVPLSLSHRLIGELIGARRPTVSTVLAELGRDGRLLRRRDGTWLLTGDPVALPAESAAEVVRQRRRLMPGGMEPEPAPVEAAPGRAEELRSAYEAARAGAEERARELDALQQETAALRARTLELRAQQARHLAALRAAAGARDAD